MFLKSDTATILGCENKSKPVTADNFKKVHSELKVQLQMVSQLRRRKATPSRQSRI
jgi:hypothetical protein